jgi:hypothetical protein
MKTPFITLIAAIALTHATYAGDWMWFHGDIGLDSPFTSSSSPVKNATIGAVTNRQVVTKPKAAADRPVAGLKSKSIRHRITAR